jgi:uncharacterized membrane protein YgdD (TMEM256/DUF423 family)
MTILNPSGKFRPRSVDAVTGPHLVLVGAFAAVVTVAAIFQKTMTDDVLLAAVTGLLFVLAALVALLAWNRPLPPRQFSYWDASGFLLFVGICFAAAIEPDQLVHMVADTNRAP